MVISSSNHQLLIDRKAANDGPEHVIKTGAQYIRRCLMRSASPFKLAWPRRVFVFLSCSVQSREPPLSANCFSFATKLAARPIVLHRLVSQIDNWWYSLFSTTHCAALRGFSLGRKTREQLTIEFNQPTEEIRINKWGSSYRRWKFALIFITFFLCPSLSSCLFQYHFCVALFNKHLEKKKHFMSSPWE